MESENSSPQPCRLQEHVYTECTTEDEKTRNVNMSDFPANYTNTTPVDYQAQVKAEAKHCTLHSTRCKTQKENKDPQYANNYYHAKTTPFEGSECMEKNIRSHSHLTSMDKPKEKLGSTINHADNLKLNGHELPYAKSPLDYGKREEAYTRSERTAKNLTSGRALNCSDDITKSRSKQPKEASQDTVPYGPEDGHTENAASLPHNDDTTAPILKGSFARSLKGLLVSDPVPEAYIKAGTYVKHVYTNGKSRLTKITSCCGDSTETGIDDSARFE